MPGNRAARSQDRIGQFGVLTHAFPGMITVDEDKVHPAMVADEGLGIDLAGTPIRSV